MGFRILSIAPTSFFADYGCHVRILEEIRALARRGHHTTLCTYHTGRTPPDLDVIRMPRVPWASSIRIGSSLHKLYFDMLLGARSLIASVGPVDLVHAHLHEGAAIGLAVARLRRVPLVFDYQGSLTREMLDHRFIRADSPLMRPLEWLEHFIERRADAIVTSSSHGAEHLRASHRRPLNRVRVVPDGIGRGSPVNGTSMGTSRDALRASLGIPPGRFVVAYLGLLADYQGVDHILYAARQVVERRRDVHFLIMGYPGLEQYRRQAYDLQILDRVTFTGRIPYEEASAHLDVADIAISAKRSATEANGKLLNYMDAGLPTVVYDTPVAREMLGHLGTYVQAGDITGLAGAIEALLNDPVHREHLAIALRARVRAEFSWDDASALLEEEYTRVLGWRRPVTAEAAR
jgi:glycosyltransferase involved in cell wall biosynthesis